MRRSESTASGVEGCEMSRFFGSAHCAPREFDRLIRVCAVQAGMLTPPPIIIDLAGPAISLCISPAQLQLFAETAAASLQRCANGIYEKRPPSAGGVARGTHETVSELSASKI
jgi:hypothetical protein